MQLQRRLPVHAERGGEERRRVQVGGGHWRRRQESLAMLLSPDVTTFVVGLEHEVQRAMDLEQYGLYLETSCNAYMYRCFLFVLCVGI